MVVCTNYTNDYDIQDSVIANFKMEMLVQTLMNYIIFKGEVV